jgi:hypothetical protein
MSLLLCLPGVILLPRIGSPICLWHKQAAFDAGAQGYLVTPIGIDDLLPEVERLIAANGSLDLTQGARTAL